MQVNTTKVEMCSECTARRSLTVRSVADVHNYLTAGGRIELNVKPLFLKKVTAILNFKTVHPIMWNYYNRIINMD